MKLSSRRFVTILGVCISCAFATAEAGKRSHSNKDNKGISVCEATPSNTTIFDFEVTDLSGHSTTLSGHRGHVTLVVNVATFCGLTEQYLDFNPLLEKYSKGNAALHIAAFPCNQFLLQEPGNESEILNGLKYVRPGKGWEPHKDLTIYGKLNVNGDDAHPLFEYLRGSCPATTNLIVSKENAFWTPFTTRDITWNFEKFLVDVNGRPRYRFHPKNWHNGDVVREYIEKLTAEAGQANGQDAV